MTATARRGEFDDVDNTPVQTDRCGVVLTVGDVRNFLNRGFNTKSILRARPDIEPRAIAMARAFLIATDPEYYSQVASEPPKEPYEIIVDECLSDSSIMPGLHSLFGPSVHTKHVGLNGLGDSGKGDGDLWRYAVNEGYDAIITSDWKKRNDQMDLVAIAYKDAQIVLKGMDRVQADRPIDLPELPVVIRFKAKSNRNIFKSASGANGKKPPQSTIELINRHRDAIRSYLETRTTPCIDVLPGGVRIDQTYAELHAELTGKIEPVRDMKTRRDRFVEVTMARIMATRRSSYLTPEQINKTEAMVRAAAAITIDGRTDDAAHEALHAARREAVSDQHGPGL